MHPFLFVPLKLGIALLAVWAIETETKSSEWKWLLRLLVLVVGLAPGVRDAARILMGV
ncbi:MAG: DUF63 family protein [Candidatus Diapherotrites archaeon]|nr:DUF63 family protein [Candidatus Diapherotrites archaeon]